MKELGVLFTFAMIFTAVGSYTGLWKSFAKKTAEIKSYERQALLYEKEYKVLKLKYGNLKSQIIKLKAEKEHILLSSTNTHKKINKSKAFREIASVSSKKNEGDLVHYDLYQWSPEKMLDLGAQSLHFQKFEKAAQFYNILLTKYPKHELITDEVLFNAGVAAFESKKHYDWAQKHFSKITKKKVASKFSRKAKLWLALSYHKSGDSERFIASVEEFRLKYRNTKEWRAISGYYEDIAFKFKKK